MELFQGDHVQLPRHQKLLQLIGGGDEGFFSGLWKEVLEPDDLLVTRLLPQRWEEVASVSSGAKATSSP